MTDTTLIERLLRTRLSAFRPYKGDTHEFVNPDGPDAADLIERQAARIAELERGIEDVRRNLGDDDYVILAISLLTNEGLR